jgi:hypothetical protein
MGVCTCGGRLATAKPKPLKRDLTHHLLRFEDKKWLKAHGIPAATLTVAKDRMDWSVEAQD